MESKLKEIFNFLTTVKKLTVVYPVSWTQDIQINTICADKFELRSQSSVLSGGNDVSMQGTFRLLLQPPVVLCGQCPENLLSLSHPRAATLHSTSGGVTSLLKGAALLLSVNTLNASHQNQPDSLESSPLNRLSSLLH